MKRVEKILLCALACLTISFRSGFVSDGVAEERRSRIPALRGLDGKYTPEGLLFSTRAYESEALHLIVLEANQVARDLDIPEKLPITTNDLSHAFVVRYGMAQAEPRSIGAVHTRNFGYFVSVDHKLSYVEKSNQDEQMLKWMAEFNWPKSLLDTNQAYQLATQWLSAAKMDVARLNRECRVVIEPEQFANKGRQKSSTFVPVYFAHWLSPENQAKGYGNVASVKLFLPTKTLVSLRVEDSKYILRKPVSFRNLDALLSEKKP